MKHVLIHCPNSETLFAAAGHRDLANLLTYDAKLTATWAIGHLEIDQFANVREEYRKRFDKMKSKTR